MFYLSGIFIDFFFPFTVSYGCVTSLQMIYYAGPVYCVGQMLCRYFSFSFKIPLSFFSLTILGKCSIFMRRFTTYLRIYFSMYIRSGRTVIILQSLKFPEFEMVFFSCIVVFPFVFHYIFKWSKLRKIVTGIERFILKKPLGYWVNFGLLWQFQFTA